jgi:drug/metabolite transporter (DMT)-like permease
VPIDVLLFVLFGALLHAGWNAMVKAGTDKSLDAAMIALGAAVIALPFLPFMPLPNADAVPFLLASAFLQFGYFHLVAAASSAGDIGLVYPLMRGGAPLLIAATSSLIVGETLTRGATAGIVAISAGIFTLAFEARRSGRRAIILALLNAVFIAAYTFVDGIGARISGNAISYTLWMALLPPVLLFGWAIARRGIAPVARHVGRNAWRGLMGGAGSIGSYGIALWAMTKAPVATVAALRETSILFAIVISVTVLKERISPFRIAAAILIALGALLLKLA